MERSIELFLVNRPIYESDALDMNSIQMVSINSVSLTNGILQITTGFGHVRTFNAKESELILEQSHELIKEHLQSVDESLPD